jgi:anti-sigma factor RsiW
MTVDRRQPRECDAARALASRALDSPLPELDLRRLDAHLAECPACDELVGGMTELTARLRTAPELASPVVVRSRRVRRPGRAAFQVAGIAAVVAAFAGLGALVASPAGAPPPEAQPRIVVAERTDLRGALRDARLIKLWVASEPGTQRSPHPRGIFA